MATENGLCSTISIIHKGWNPKQIVVKFKTALFHHIFNAESAEHRTRRAWSVSLYFENQ